MRGIFPAGVRQDPAKAEFFQMRQAVGIVEAEDVLALFELVRPEDEPGRPGAGGSAENGRGLFHAVDAQFAGTGFQGGHQGVKMIFPGFGQVDGPFGKS